MTKVDKSNMDDLNDRAEQVAAILSLMGNAHRLRILCRLAEGETSVGSLTREIDLSQSALSQHLAKLRESGLVETRREAQTIFYRLATEEMRAIMAALYEVFCGPEADARDLPGSRN